MAFPMILDIIVLAVLIVSTVVSAKAGFFKSIYKLGVFAATIIIVMFFANTVTDFVMDSPVGIKVYEAVHEKLETAVPLSQDQQKEIESNEDVDKKDINSLNPMRMIGIPDTALGEVIPKSINSMAQNTAYCIVKVITCIALFILVRLLLMIVFAILNIACKLPVLNQANSLLGAACGFLNGLILVFVICGIVMIFVGSKNDIVSVIDSTQIFKYFYNRNILMDIFL